MLGMVLEDIMVFLLEAMEAVFFVAGLADQHQDCNC